MSDTRAHLQQEIEETRQAYHHLLDEIPESAYRQPSDNPAWTIAEVLYHMSLAPRMIGTDVRMITGQSWYFRLVPVLFPRRLFDWLNIRVTRFGARRATRQSLAVEYDKVHAMALKALTSVSDQEFSKSLNYPDWDPLLSGEVTLEQLFHYIKAHFDGHAAQIRKVLSYDERK